MELTGARTKFANQNVGTCLWHVFAANRKLSTHHPTCRRHVPTLWRYRFEKFDTTSYQEIILSSGFFRRETASGFYPWGNVEGPRKRVAEGLCGWRHGNSFPMTKAHSRTAKCEAFHVAPRLFFMFLFLITLTIRQQSIIYPHKFSTDSIPAYTHQIPNGISLHLFRDNLYIISTKNGVAIFGRHPIN